MVIARVQTRDDSGSGEKWSNSGYMLKLEPKGCADKEVRKWRGKKKESKRWPQGFWSELGLELSAPTSILLLLPSALYSLFTDIFHVLVQNCPCFSCDIVFAILFTFSFIFHLKVTKKQTKLGKHKLPCPELNSICWDLWPFKSELPLSSLLNIS